MAKFNTRSLDISSLLPRGDLGAIARGGSRHTSAERQSKALQEKLAEIKKKNLEIGDLAQAGDSGKTLPIKRISERGDIYLQFGHIGYHPSAITLVSKGKKKKR